MSSIRERRRIRGCVVVVVAAAVAVSCGGSTSPRPNTTATPPPVPAGTTPLGRVTWTAVAYPDLGEEAHLYDAAARPGAFVLVGDTGAFGFHGVVLRSTDGRAWTLVDDADVAPWSLSTVIGTDAGFLAIGGRFSNTQPGGSTGWASALLTSPDGSDWTVREAFEGMEISTVAANGSLVVATTRGPTLLVSHDTGATWKQVNASDVGFATGTPRVLDVLGSGTWVALGTAGTSAAAWSSADGLAWEAATIEAADPVSGVKSVTPTSIATGASGAVAAGTDDPQECEEGDDFCGSYGAGWTTEDGEHWMRLPRGTPLTDGWGVSMWSAGSAGVVANGPALRQSANGWKWTTVAGTSSDMWIDVFALRDRTAVAAGSLVTSDVPKQSMWVGVIGDR